MSTPAPAGAGGAGSKTTQISKLVQELKNGEITKAELFDKLAQLQQRPAEGAAKAGSGGAASGTAGAGIAATSAATPAPMQASAGGSQRSAADATAERRARLQQLIEDKRRSLEAEATQTAGATPAPQQPIAGAAAAAAAKDATAITAQQYMSGTPQQMRQHQAQLLQKQAAQYAQQLSHSAASADTTEFQQAAMPPPAPPGTGVTPAPTAQAAGVAMGGSSSAAAPAATPASHRAAFGADEFDRLRRKMLATAFTVHGVGLETLFARQSRSGVSDETMTGDEFKAMLQQLLPAAVDAGQANRLANILGRGRGGRIEFRDFVALFGGDQAAQAHAVPPYPFPAGGEQSRAEMAAQEKAERQLKECTFKPRIRPLPQSYGRPARDKDVPFHQRVAQWQEHKKQEQDRIRQEHDSAELRECTFQPTINPNPDPTAIGGSPDGMAVGGADGGGSKHRGTGMSASQRLYANSKSTRSKEDEQRVAEEREREELERTCTFRPQINRGRRTPQAAARYRQVDYTPRGKGKGGRPSTASAALSGASSARKPYRDPECTFTPKVNQLKRGMASAKVYCKAGVYDRLSNPDGTRAADQNGDLSQASGADASGLSNSSNIMNMASFMDRARGGPAQQEHRTPSTASRAERQKNFHQFLHRQNNASVRKKKSIENMRKQMQPSFTPKMQQNEKYMVSDKFSFEQRMLADITKRRAKMDHAKIKSEANEDCTFKPKITMHKSVKDREDPKNHRTALEMSRGDMLKKETAHRIMKLKAEQEELADLTFKPSIHSAGGKHDHVEGKIRILSEPQTYLQRLQQSAKAFSEKQRRAVQAHEMAEFAQCTFQPKIHDAPAYVKRIAHSMRLARAGQARTNAAADKKKPDWR